jgi:hypothetical protein
MTIYTYGSQAVGGVTLNGYLVSAAQASAPNVRANVPVWSKHYKTLREYVAARGKLK